MPSEKEEATGESTKYVALDIHKDSITEAVACMSQKAPRHYSAIAAAGEALARLCDNLAVPTRTRDVVAVFLCGGYVCVRHVSTVTGVGLRVRCGGTLADSATARRPHQDGSSGCAFSGAALQERRVDPRVGARRSAGVEARSGAVPRRLFKHTERRVRQRLISFFLGHGRHYGVGRRCSHAHIRWLETQRFSHPAQQIVLQEYVDAVQEAQGRIRGLD